MRMAARLKILLVGLALGIIFAEADREGGKKTEHKHGRSHVGKNKVFHSQGTRNSTVKFVIIATPRSGSTWLASAIRHTSGVALHKAECFHTQKALHNCVNEWKVPGFGMPASVSESMMKPIEYLTPILSLPESAIKTHVGFKWMVNQGLKTRTDRVQALRYFNTHDVKIVVLERENFLRKCYSRYDMRRKIQINEPIFDHPTFEQRLALLARIQWEVPYHFWTWCLHRTRKDSQALRHMVVNGSQVLVVKYKKLCRKRTRKEELRKIQEFLGLSYEINPNVDTIKSHRGDLHNLIKNWDIQSEKLSDVFPEIHSWEQAECDSDEAFSQESASNDRSASYATNGRILQEVHRQAQNMSQDMRIPLEEENTAHTTLDDSQQSFESMVRSEGIISKVISGIASLLREQTQKEKGK